MNLKKTLIVSIVFCLGFLGLGTIFSGTVFGLSFEGDYAGPMTKWSDTEEKVFDINIDQNATFLENIKKVFYPDVNAENVLWKALRNISVGVLLFFLVWSGIKFLLFAPDSEEELTSARKSVLYIIFGAAILFLVIWILGTALNIAGVEGITSDGTTKETLLGNFENNLLIVILSFLKGMAFFVAIIFLVWYGYQMMSAMSDEEKIKNSRKGILNVLLALVFIKVIDYLYFIAQQADFKSRAIQLIVEVTKFLGYIGGIMFVIAIIYAGHQFVTAGGDDEKIKKAKTVIKSVFIIILVILLFMLVIYQVFNDLVV